MSPNDIEGWWKNGDGGWNTFDTRRCRAGNGSSYLAAEMERCGVPQNEPASPLREPQWWHGFW